MITPQIPTPQIPVVSPTAAIVAAVHRIVEMAAAQQQVRAELDARYGPQ